MSLVMTKDGWKALSPKEYQAPGYTPSLLDRMGINMDYQPLKAMADYANGKGRGVYFTYYPNGLQEQTKGAINPLPDMYAEKVED
jgi:antitoxin component YwqK of YwqJK toxin-antitoxin module